MRQRPRIYYSDSQKALMWERWKQDWTLHEIGKLFDLPHSSIHQILADTGGIRPAQRSRSSTAIDAVRARGDLAIHGDGRIDPLNSNSTRSRTIDHQSGNQAQWGPQ